MFRKSLFILGLFIVPLFLTSCSRPTEFTTPNLITSSYLGSLTPLPRDNGGYGSKGSVFIPDERTIVFTNFSLNTSKVAPDALIYLGNGGNGASYVDNGEAISGVLGRYNNQTLTLNLNQDLKDYSYTHLAIVCRQFRFLINAGVKFKPN